MPPPEQDEIHATKEPEAQKKEIPPAVSVVNEPVSGSPPVPFYEPQKAFENENGPSHPVLITKTNPAQPKGKPVSLKIHEKHDSKKDDKEDVSVENQPRDEISNELFQQTWKVLADSFVHESQSLFVALTSYEPSLNPEGMIKVKVDNTFQEKLINDRKADLLVFLRKELNNYGIQLETMVLENTRQQKAYLPKEKLEKMVEKNPAVARLCKELDLDVMY
ncbi:MAG TPA: hypothetical protein VLH61_01125 [Bacteroidales bacterium]|nr:hypothetical protein [Bacteroidales bacterium]